MACHAALASETDEDACVLNGAVRIKELCAHGADPVLRQLGNHFAEPVSGDDFGVVVQQAEQGAFRFANGKIVDSRIIEDIIILQYTDSLILGDRAEVLERFRQLALVVDNQDLVALIVRLLDERCDARRQKVHTIARRNNDRDMGLRRGDFELKAVVPDTQVCIDRAIYAAARQGFFQGLRAGDDGVRFLTRRQGGRPGQDSPVVKNMRHMDDVCRADAFGDTQNEIVILGSLEPRPETTNLEAKILPHRAEVGDHVLLEEQSLVPVRLEVGVAALAVEVDLVLVRINELRVGVPIYRLGNAEEGMRRQEVIMVKQRDPVARCDLNRRVRSF